jgi:biofilm PGA synthesis protein PgaA
MLVIGLAILALGVRTAYPADAAGDTSIKVANANYRAAIEDARAGRFELALAALRPLVDKYPQRQDILGDYAIVLGWSGDDAAALVMLDRIDQASAPAYVLEGIASSARRLQRYDLAESMYREVLTRFPGRMEAEIGLALTLADAGNTDAAWAIIETTRMRFPHRPEVLLAVAAIATAKHDNFGALAAYQEILAQDATHRAALRGKIQVLVRLGTPQLAIELADRNPGLLTPDERAAIAADVTAHLIRWGTVAADTGRGPGRFAGLDLALADSDAAATRALNPTAGLSVTERELVFDRISALRERFRMREALALFDAMSARPAPVPAYAASAAASACLYLKRPERARDLYRQALATDPDNLQARIGLFYALAESEQHDAALVQIQRTVTATPQWIDAWSQATTIENPDYGQVLSARAMAPLFANRPGETELRLRELSSLAPYDMDIRTDYASSMRARGWPRTAEEELRWVLKINPDSSGALGERAGALLEMRDYREAEAALAAAQAVSAEDGRVVRAARMAEIHDLRELIVDDNFGRSSGGGGPKGTQDNAFESWLYSGPLDYNYRVFAHIYSAEATFADGTGRRNREGAGVEYRSPLITATGELSHGVNGGENGAAASLAFTPDDYWTFRAIADTSSNELPLQATLAGINARRYAGEIVWQANESRSAAVSVAQMDFSDGNRRDSAQARWTERVVAGPVYKLEITGSLYASRNSLADASYFNPSRDFSPTLEFANEWLQWRRYTRAFHQRLVIAVGDYWQQGFGSGPLYGARYEQEWEANDRLSFRYGIGRTLNPYDGVQTARNYAYFHLDWRF